MDPQLTIFRWAESTLWMFDNTALKTEGMLTIRVEHPVNQQVRTLDFYIATTHIQPILGLEACLSFDLLSVNEENICAVQSTSPTLAALTTEVIESRYADMFVGYGTLPGEIHLETDPTVVPVQMPLRQLPVPIKDNVIAELRKLCDDGAIAIDLGTAGGQKTKWRHSNLHRSETVK